MPSSLTETLKRADREVLDEIVREAESRLSAQLTAALAADARAMNFLGFMAAISVAVVGASLAVLESDGMLALIGLCVGLGMAASGFFAFNAAKPIDFEFTGNYPSQWAEDIENGVTMHDALAEQAAHYDEMLLKNKTAIEANASQLETAASLARTTFLVGCAAAIAYFTARFVGAL